MDAGALDQRIVIESPSSTTDELGQDALTWSAYDGAIGGRWAKVIETPGREFLKGDYHAEEKTVFVVRWGAFDSTMRVQWGGRTWDIVSVTGTRRDMFCYLHTLATDGAN